MVKNYNDANTLILKGYKILKIDRDINDRKVLIFLFENNINILKELKNLSKSYR